MSDLVSPYHDGLPPGGADMLPDGEPVGCYATPDPASPEPFYYYHPESLSRDDVAWFICQQLTYHRAITLTCRLPDGTFQHYTRADLVRGFAPRGLV